MTVDDIYWTLNDFAPLEYQADYDNSGLMVGDVENPVSGVMLCLDATFDVLQKAKEKDCNLVVCHHPLIFEPLTQIVVHTEKGRILEFALKNSISILAYHTNLDTAEEGLNYQFAKKCKGKNISVEEDGCLFEIKKTTLQNFAKLVSKTIGDSTLRIAGKKDKEIEKVFVITGAGGRDEEAYQFAKENADVFVSAEMKHNFLISAVEDDFAIVEFSHFYSEVGCIELFEKVIGKAFPNLKIEKERSCPFWTVEEI